MSNILILKNNGEITIFESAKLLTSLYIQSRFLDIKKQWGKQTILNQKIVLCKQLCENKAVLNQLNLKALKITRILTEANELCKLQL